MGDQTQQSWAFRVGDGAGTEVFTQLEGQYEAPEFTPNNYTTRDATTIADAQAGNTKKYKFNKMKDGAELAIAADWIPDEVGQARLIAQSGDDAGVNCQMEITGSDATYLWEFNVLVISYPVTPAASTDENAVERVTFNLKVNSDVTETVS